MPSLDESRLEIQELVRKNVELALALGDAEHKAADLQKKHDKLASEKERLEELLRQRNVEARRLELELRTAISKIAELRGTVRKENGCSESLKTQIKALKEKLLTQLASPDPPTSSERLASLFQGAPGEVFSNVLQEVLGPPGRALVEQLYLRYEVDISNTEPEVLSLIADRLQPMAMRLARTPEQAERVRLGLNRCRSFLRLPTTAAPLRAGLPRRAEARMRPAPLLNPKNAPVVASDLSRRLEYGMKLVALERYEQALEVFQDLAPLYPECVEVYAGLFYAYAGFGCYTEAHEVGRKLHVALTGEARERFLKTFTGVVCERVDTACDPCDAKRWLLELAELHRHNPRRAVAFLRRASRIPETIEDEGMLELYLRELLPLVEGDPEGNLSEAS